MIYRVQDLVMGISLALLNIWALFEEFWNEHLLVKHRFELLQVLLQVS